MTGCFNMRPAILATALLALTTASAGAQDLRDLVEAALDERITSRVEIEEQPVRAALRELEGATGLRFELDPHAVDWMPYGAQTRISIALQDVSVRQALGRIFDGLGLQMRVADDVVVVEPAPALDRLGRRLTLDEVKLLQTLAAAPWDALRDAPPIRFRLPPGEDYRSILEAEIAAGAAVPAIDQLETATRNLGWYWVPEGSEIVVYSQSENIAQRLERPLDLHYRRMPLDEMLLDLGRRVGVTFQFEPGALQKVDASARQVDLIQRSMPLRQVLELVCGNTGLWYEVTEAGVYIGAAPSAEESRANRPKIVAILRVPVGEDGTTIDFLLREDELPVEFAELRDRKLPEVIELLRQRLTDDD
jgi:hypothetical protein